ncbi:hypothetical protein [Desulfotomaculum defluvii]
MVIFGIGGKSLGVRHTASPMGLMPHIASRPLFKDYLGLPVYRQSARWALLILSFGPADTGSHDVGFGVAGTCPAYGSFECNSHGSYVCQVANRPCFEAGLRVGLIAT